MFSKKDHEEVDNQDAFDREQDARMNAGAVYVDEPLEWPLEHVAGAAKRHGSRWCHLWTDPGNEEALHRVAGKTGLKRAWFQNRPGFPHYDIVPGKRAKAIAAGAVACSLCDWISSTRRAM